MILQNELVCKTVADVKKFTVCKFFQKTALIIAPMQNELYNWTIG